MPKMNICSILFFSILQWLAFDVIANNANNNSTHELEIKCIVIPKMSVFDGEDIGKEDGNRKISNNLLSNSSQSTSCVALGPDSKRLIGAGDIIIGVPKDDLAKILDSIQSANGQLTLFLNGVSLTNDASLIVAENVDSLTLLRFRISQGQETQKLWSILYSDGGLIKPQPLYVAIGLRSTSSSEIQFIPTRSQVRSEVSITTGLRFGFASLLVLILIGVMFYLGIRTDLFRDAPDSMIPLWWKEARKLKITLDGMENKQKCEAYLSTLYPSFSAMPTLYYDELASQALKGYPVNDKDIDTTKIGLALKIVEWKPVRASYSLSRIQMALWFAFAVATGVFLWVLYGDLRNIDGSLLVLLGISVGTAGASWMTDRNSDGGRPYSPSRGLSYDLLTGFDERKQLHRYQSVVVNILLLVVGIDHVVQELSYPVFESTWLLFLGISGSAYGIGKQVLES